MIQIFEEDERVSRDGHELALDTAAKRAAARLFARVGAYVAEGVVQYPRAGTVAFSWLQKSAHADHET